MKSSNSHIPAKITSHTTGKRKTDFPEHLHKCKFFNFLYVFFLFLNLSFFQFLLSSFPSQILNECKLCVQKHSRKLQRIQDKSPVSIKFLSYQLKSPHIPLGKEKQIFLSICISVNFLIFFMFSFFF